MNPETVPRSEDDLQDALSGDDDLGDRRDQGALSPPSIHGLHGEAAMVFPLSVTPEADPCPKDDLQDAPLIPPSLHQPPPRRKDLS